MFNAEHRNKAGQNKAICQIDVTNSTNEIQFSLFKNGGKIPAKKFTISYSKELEFNRLYTGVFERDHNKSFGVTFGQFAACYSRKNLHSI